MYENDPRRPKAMVGAALSQPGDYYEGYWDQREREQRSGDRCGYAQNFRRWMDQWMKNRNSDDVLEVGCGDCQFTTDLMRLSRHLVAIDISKRQIDRNRSRYPEIEFQVHDCAEPLPFSDESFDVVWCSEVLEHLFNPGFTLSEIFRTLKLGGTTLVTVPHHGRLKSIAIAIFKFEKHYDPCGPHIRFFTATSLASLTRRCGFRIDRIDHCGMGRPVRDLFISTNLLMAATKAVG